MEILKINNNAITVCANNSLLNCIKHNGLSLVKFDQIETSTLFVLNVFNVFQAYCFYEEYSPSFLDSFNFTLLH